MSDQYSQAVNTAREYYNSDDADNFYAIIWGGEDIHIGWYDHPRESIVEASHRTVQHMAQKLGNTIDSTAHILDIGSGYGGAARYLAQHFGSKVTALNLSEKENQRARELNRQKGLAQQIDVVDGSFEYIPSENKQFDLVWSQDAILHSGQRQQVIAEVSRVLKPGGLFLFTDPMQADNCPEGVLQPILDRIHLSSLGSPAFYRTTCQQYGLDEISFEESTEQLITHYSRVLQETEQRQHELSHKISPEYVERMKKGLKHWIDGGNEAYLCWGIFLFRKK